MSDFNIKVGTSLDTTGLDKQLSAKTYKVTTTVVTKGGTEYEKTVTKLKDDTGKLYEATTMLNKSTGEASAKFTKASENTKQLSTDMKTAEKSGNTLSSRFVDITKKVIAFGAVTSLIGLFTKAMVEAVTVVKEFDSAMTEFNKVSNLSDESLDNYTAKLGELGTEIARTKTQMVEASTEFVKSGYTEEQSAQLAKVAGLYQNVADSELSSADASAYLISQMKAFNITATDAIKIIDMTNSVGNKFAVSTTDISTALTKSSSALATYGNTMSESISLTTAGTELMTGQASKVSKGLRSIGANIVKLADDTGVLEYSVGGATKSLSLFNDEGEALSTFDVLSKVAEDWNKMSQAEQSSLALAQAG